MNGVASGSEAGEDTASLGGSESDASRTDGKMGTRPKKPASFKPVSFAKFSVPKAPGASPTIKPAEKGIHVFLPPPSKVSPRRLSDLSQPLYLVRAPLWGHRRRAQGRVWLRKLRAAYETLCQRPGPVPLNQEATDRIQIKSGIRTDVNFPPLPP